MSDSIDINFKFDDDKHNPLRSDSEAKELKDAAKELKEAAFRIGDNGRTVHRSLGSAFASGSGGSRTEQQANEQSGERKSTLREAVAKAIEKQSVKAPSSADDVPSSASHKAPVPRPQGTPSPSPPPGFPNNPSPPSPGSPNNPAPNPGPGGGAGGPPGSGGSGAPPSGGGGRGGNISGIVGTLSNVVGTLGTAYKGLFGVVKGAVKIGAMGVGAGGGVAGLAHAATGQAGAGLTGGSMVGGIMGATLGTLVGSPGKGAMLGASLGGAIGGFGYDSARERYKKYSPGIQLAEAEVNRTNVFRDMERAREVDAPMSRMTKLRGALGTAVDDVQHAILKAILRFEPQIKQFVETLTGMATYLTENIPLIAAFMEGLMEVVKLILKALDWIIYILSLGLVDVSGSLKVAAEAGRRYKKELDKKDIKLPDIFGVGGLFGQAAGATPKPMPTSGGGDNFNWNW